MNSNQKFTYDTLLNYLHTKDDWNDGDKVSLRAGDFEELIDDVLSKGSTLVSPGDPSKYTESLTSYTMNYFDKNHMPIKLKIVKII